MMRWSKFWWADYEGDDALRSCSLAAQGLWMRLLCSMHKGEPYGYLTINGRAATARQMAAIASAPEREVVKLLAELEDAGVFSRDENGAIYSRRMVRDKAAHEQAAAYGRKGGNPSLKSSDNPGDNGSDNGGVNPPLIPQEAEAKRKEKEPPSPPSVVRSPRGSRLSPDWHPELKEVRFALDLGLNPNAVLDQFRDYWTAKAGKDAVKLDWSATWRGWCRREAENAKRRAPQAKPSKLAWMFEEMAAEREDPRVVDAEPWPQPATVRLVQ